MNTGQTGQTVTVMARGAVLDSASFPGWDAAVLYKQAVRRWALESRVAVQIVCRDARAGLALAS